MASWPISYKLPQVMIDRIAAERQGQIEKWGDQSYKDHLEWLAILTEEVGEVAQGILRYRDDGEVNQITDELVHAVAVAVAWLEKIDGENDG